MIQQGHQFRNSGCKRGIRLVSYDHRTRSGARERNVEYVVLSSLIHVPEFCRVGKKAIIQVQI